MIRLAPALRLLAIPVLVLAGACAEPEALSARQDHPTQTADIGLTGRIHFNTQTGDFARSRAFYRMLGFTAGVGGFPKTNTHEMARSLGMYDLCTYEIQEIEVISIPASWGPTSIDLIQFAEPFNPAPPYESPTHLGMAYAALLTTDLDADVTRMREQGMEFLSEPYGVPGNRFVFFTDPDGVFFKLEETAPPHADPDREMQIRAMPYVALNVSDFERALAFYRRLGYTESADRCLRPAFSRKPVPTGWMPRSSGEARRSPFRVETGIVSSSCSGSTPTTTSRRIRPRSTTSASTASRSR